MISYKSTYHEPVSAKARRLGWSIEHFVGESLVCVACERPFRCFREFEPMCGACRPPETIYAG